LIVVASVAVAAAVGHPIKRVLEEYADTGQECLYECLAATANPDCEALRNRIPRQDAPT
jgi:hypothetical protein